MLEEFLKQNFMLVTVAVTSGCVLSWELFKASSGGEGLSAAEATQKINREDAVVIDVRDPSEFATGHIVGARNIPANKLAERIGELEKFKEQTLIVNCQAGTRSGSACKTLQQNGFTKVFNLRGGIGAWADAGLPLTKGKK